MENKTKEFVTEVIRLSDTENIYSSSEMQTNLEKINDVANEFIKSENKINPYTTSIQPPIESDVLDKSIEYLKKNWKEKRTENDEPTNY